MPYYMIDKIDGTWIRYKPIYPDYRYEFPTTIGENRLFTIPNELNRALKFVDPRTPVISDMSINHQFVDPKFVSVYIFV